MTIGPPPSPAPHASPPPGDPPRSDSSAAAQLSAAVREAVRLGRTLVDEGLLSVRESISGVGKSIGLLLLQAVAALFALGFVLGGLASAISAGLEWPEWAGRLILGVAILATIATIQLVQSARGKRERMAKLHRRYGDPPAERPMRPPPPVVHPAAASPPPLDPMSPPEAAHV